MGLAEAPGNKRIRRQASACDSLAVFPEPVKWAPLAAFFAIGLFLFWYHPTHRDLPKLKLPGF